MDVRLRMSGITTILSSLQIISGDLSETQDTFPITMSRRREWGENAGKANVIPLPELPVLVRKPGAYGGCKNGSTDIGLFP